MLLRRIATVVDISYSLRYHLRLLRVIHIRLVRIGFGFPLDQKLKFLATPVPAFSTPLGIPKAIPVAPKLKFPKSSYCRASGH
jgi:hypothetical protein